MNTPENPTPCEYINPGDPAWETTGNGDISQLIGLGLSTTATYTTQDYPELDERAPDQNTIDIDV